VTVTRARRLGSDFVKLQPRATFFSEAFGNRYRPSGHRLRAPVLERAAVTELASWKSLELVDESVLDEQVRALRLVVDRLGPDVPVIQTVFSPMSVGSYLLDRDNRRLVRELRREPEVVVPALERVAEALTEFARRSVEAGAAGIFYAVSGFATPDSMPRAIFEELVLPMDRRVLAALPAEAWFNVLHLCGSHVYVEVGRDLPVEVVSYSVHNAGNPPLGRARELTGKPVMGGLEQRGALVSGPAEVIAEQVRAAVAETGGRSLFLAPGCSVPPRAPEANLMAMMTAVAGA
jgi:uroporphyrinogen decarboxylase